MTEREQALDILLSVDDGAFATPLLDALQGETRDVNFIRTLVLGVLRWQLRLDYVIEQLAARRVARIDRMPMQLLRMGIYQLMFMEVPTYAAVSETVTLTGQSAARAKGFVNAVLRKATASDLHAMLPPDSGDELARLPVEFAHPKWLVERWVSSFGVSRTKAILASNQSFSHPDLLVNERRLSIEAAEEILTAKQISFERSSITPGVLRIEAGTSKLREEIAAGLFYPMDEASVLVATLVDVHHGRVLDLAAAPGGKSLVMALRGGNVTSNDISPQRLYRLRRLLPRFVDGQPSLVVSDARAAAFRRGAFHSVLLDAPCSATGTIRKSPEIKWRLTREAIEAFGLLQREMITEALKLDPEVCIYSTCSLEPEENDGVIDHALASTAHYRLDDAGEVATREAHRWIRDGVLRITPESGTDGFTAFVLRRTS